MSGCGLRRAGPPAVAERYTGGMRLPWLLLLTLPIVCGGCRGMRLVMDLVPAEDALVETIVLEDKPGSWFAPKVALIDVSGVILDARRPGFPGPGPNPVADLAEGLRKAEHDAAVRAVLLRINSPGGAVTASDVMHGEVIGFRQRTGKPVAVLFGDLGASGAYYLACAGDEIIAHPTTITGSIGVIIQTFNFSEGMRRVGIRADAIVSGDKKAAGSPFEPMPPDHRALLQGLVDEFHANFLAVVRAGRAGLSDEALNEVRDGRVVTGKRAYELGLVDRIGDLRSAFAAAKDLAGLPGARLVKYHRPLEHVGSAYGQAQAHSAAGTQINLLQMNLEGSGAGAFEPPRFYYLWDPLLFGE
jgi:protease IV